MPAELSFFAAVLIGLLGSTHCVGMCGGIVGALSLGVSPQSGGSTINFTGILLAYNAGRIVSYMLAGLITGFIGSQFQLLDARVALPVLVIVSGLFIISLGLYLAGWWRGLVLLENLGAKLWKRIEPLGRRFLPVGSVPQALAIGLLWGWLPCGLVYTALAWSLLSESALQGALLMLGFGLGTLPMLLLMGGMANQMRQIVTRPLVRQSMAVVLILMGFAVIANSLLELPVDNANLQLRAGPPTSPA
ncbi:MAG: sulfite exporter TauE/SafE family protein [bacterium]